VNTNGRMGALSPLYDLSANEVSGIQKKTHLPILGIGNFFSSKIELKSLLG
jgi:hypothetical protein